MMRNANLYAACAIVGNDAQIKLLGTADTLQLCRTILRVQESESVRGTVILRLGGVVAIDGPWTPDQIAQARRLADDEASVAVTDERRRVAHEADQLALLVDQLWARLEPEDRGRINLRDAAERLRVAALALRSGRR